MYHFFILFLLDFFWVRSFLSISILISDFLSLPSIGFSSRKGLFILENFHFMSKVLNSMHVFILSNNDHYGIR